MISPELARQLIERSEPRKRLAGGRLAILALAGVVLGVALGAPGWLRPSPALAGAVTLALVVVLLVLTRRNVKRQQRRARQWTRANEAILLEDWPAAQDGLRDLLSRPADNQAVRAQGLLGLAAVADHCRQYETSQLLYEQVLKTASGLPVQQHAAAVGMAAAMLRNEELTGAVHLIDQLSRQNWPRPWKAHVELVRLLREVVMGHYDDVLDSAAPRRELFRECLSVRSGYGYGLMALGCHRRGRTQAAGRFWQDATLLIAPEKLLDHFPMLSELAEAYPACEVPL